MTINFPPHYDDFHATVILNGDKNALWERRKNRHVAQSEESMTRMTSLTDSSGHLCPTPFKFMHANRKPRHMKKDTYICKCLFLYQQLPILPGRFRPSTFGVCELNFRVRHGYG